MANRIFELAQELGITSKAILDKCRAEGIGLKNHMAPVPAGLESDIREWFARSPVARDLDEMRRIAERLAASNVESEPSTLRVLWFPDANEVRLVEVVPDTVPSDAVVAFYFGPDYPGGIPAPSAIALVLPEEVGRIPVPKGWVDWKDAQELYVAVGNGR